MKASDHREFVRQHRSLKHDIQRIEGTAPFQPGVDRDEQAMIRELKGAINTFRAKLSDHFAFEEEEGGGYLQGVLAARPTLKRKVERLRSDHEVILAALGELVMPTSESESCETLKARFVDAIRYLRRHELEELDLLQDATTRDLGTTD